MILARATLVLQRTPRSVLVLVACAWFLCIHSMSWSEKPATVVAGEGFAHDAFVNWAHFPMYGGLCLWIALAFRLAVFDGGGRAKRERLTFLLTVMAGVTDEWHQAYVPWRSADPVDLLTDVVAAMGTLWMLRAVSARLSESRLWYRFALTAAMTFLTATWAVLSSS